MSVSHHGISVEPTQASPDDITNIDVFVVFECVKAPYTKVISEL